MDLIKRKPTLCDEPEFLKYCQDRTDESLAQIEKSDRYLSKLINDPNSKPRIAKAPVQHALENPNLARFHC